MLTSDTIRRFIPNPTIRLALITVILVLLNACGDKPEQIVEDDNALVEHRGDIEKVAGKFTMTLPTGFEIRGESKGIESALIKLLEGEHATTSQEWYSFDRLHFAAGSSQIELERSMEQLTNTAEILSAFPDLALKVASFTDEGGSKETDIEIAQARAQAVVNALVELGADGSRLRAEGLRSSELVGKNSEETNRTLENKVAVQVLAE